MKKILAVAAAFALASPVAAQSTAYYLTSGDNSTGFIVQHGAIQGTFSLSWQGNYPLYPLYVTSGGLLVANRAGTTSTGFNLDGTPNGVNNPLTQGYTDQLLDGTTDGTYTYTARCCERTNGILRGDMNFDNQVIFAAPDTYFAGVTYGAGSVWAVDFYGSVSRFDMMGNLLGSWSASGLMAALAFEESTNSLWMYDKTAAAVVNFDLAGNQLSSTVVAGLSSYNIFGGEMMHGSTTSVVPEPSTYALMGAGLLAVGFVSRRRRVR